MLNLAKLKSRFKSQTNIKLFFCPEAPAIGKAVHSVSEEAEVCPIGLNGPGFSFFKWIGVVGELVGFGGYLKKEEESFDF
jgi:hypothetical protein